MDLSNNIQEVGSPHFLRGPVLSTTKATQGL